MSCHRTGRDGLRGSNAQPVEEEQGGYGEVIVGQVAASQAPLHLLPQGPGDGKGPRLASRVTGMQPLTTQMTFPAHRPHRQLDHIVARELPRKAYGEAVRLPLSDHLALVVDVSDSDR